MRILRWVLWTPTRALGAVLALTLLLGVLFTVGSYVTELAQYRKDLARYERAQAQPTTTGESGGINFTVPVPQGGASGSAWIEGDHDDHGDAHLDAAPDANQQAVGTATSFAETFYAASTFATPEEWVAALEPFVSAALTPYLEEIDPATVTGQVEDSTVAEVGVYSGTVVFDITDGTRLEVVVVSGPGGDWQVIDYAPLET